MTTGSGVRILETFTFDGKAMPYSLLGYWGCAYSFCPHGHRVKKGERCHKFEWSEGVDLAHLDCFEELRRALA